MNSGQIFVTCQYCNGQAKLVYGDFIYPHRKDLKNKAFYHCCNGHESAYVGCHPGTIKPLGVLANRELRKAKSAAHNEFDAIWRGGTMKRKQAYKWLAKQLSIPENETHIGMFTIEQCTQVCVVVNNFWKSKGKENDY